MSFGTSWASCLSFATREDEAMADTLFGSVDACFLVVGECYSTLSSGTLAHSLVLLATTRRHRFSRLLCAQNHTHAHCRSHCRVAHDLLLLPCGLSSHCVSHFRVVFVSLLRCFFQDGAHLLHNCAQLVVCALVAAPHGDGTHQFPQVFDTICCTFGHQSAGLASILCTVVIASCCIPVVGVQQWTGHTDGPSPFVGVVTFVLPRTADGVENCVQDGVHMANDSTSS